MLMIAINARAAFHQPRTGLEEYTYQLLRHLVWQAQILHREKQLLFYSPTWAHMPQEFLSATIKVLHSPYLWTQLRLGAQIIWDRPDVFFNTEQILPIGAPRASVVTVHDLAYEVFPHCYPVWHRRYLRMVTKHAVRHAKRIIAVSERTKRDISKYYGVPQHNIEVVYHGFTKRTLPHQSESLENIALHSLPTKKPYFLFVGRMEFKKNVAGVIRAFEVLHERTKKDVDLVLAGPPGFGYAQIMDFLAHSPQKSRIHYMGYVDDTTKEQLYTHALALVFISFYEGFGLPILEAQSLGIPVIASNTSCIPEIAGDGALLVNPREISDIAYALQEVASRKKITAYAIKKGYENIERFSWTKSAKETLDILLTL